VRGDERGRGVLARHQARAGGRCPRRWWDRRWWPPLRTGRFAPSRLRWWNPRRSQPSSASSRFYYDLDEDKHRSYAYERAAKSVEAAQGLHRLVERVASRTSRIGPSIARAVAELYRRGTVAVLDGMRVKWPAVVIELAQLPRIGVPRRAAVPGVPAGGSRCGRRAVPRRCAARAAGFGKVTEQKILLAIEERRLRGQRVLLFDAQPHAESIAAHCAADPR